MNNILLISDVFYINEALMSIFNEVYEVCNFTEKSKLDKLLEVDLINIDVAFISIRSEEYSKLFNLLKYKNKYNLKFKLIVLDLDRDKTFFSEVVQYNIDGYLLDIDIKEELIYKTKKILNDEKYYDTDLLYEIINEVHINNLDILSKREKEIVINILEGYTNKEIGDLLNISENTVKRHMSNILKKLKLKNRFEMIQYLKINN